MQVPRFFAGERAARVWAQECGYAVIQGEAYLAFVLAHGVGDRWDVSDPLSPRLFPDEYDTLCAIGYPTPGRYGSFGREVLYAAIDLGGREDPT